MLHSITILLPRLSGWAQQLEPDNRFPQLESLLAKSTAGAPLSANLDRLRLKLFGLQTDVEVPVAALSRLASGSLSKADSSYCLRLDPVTLQADMSRVMLMSSGFVGFPADYQQAVHEVVQQVMVAEGLDLQIAEDYWTVRLAQEPGVQFTSLDEALGADVSECLPEGAAGRYWKRLQNEIQMALHASPANEQRRQRGAALINSVWFWGGGSLPKPANYNAFAQVYSADPVSLGLAALHGMQLNDLHKLITDHSLFEEGKTLSVLVDWAVTPSSSENATQPLTPIRLEAFCQSLLAQLTQYGGKLQIQLHSPERSWQFEPRDRWRFWRRTKALSLQLADLAAIP